MGIYYLLNDKERERLAEASSTLESLFTATLLGKDTDTLVEDTFLQLVVEGENLDSWAANKTTIQLALNRGIYDSTSEETVNIEGEIWANGYDHELPKEDWRWKVILQGEDEQTQKAIDLDYKGKAHALLLATIDQAPTLRAAHITKAAVSAIKKELKLPPQFCFLGAADYLAILKAKKLLDLAREGVPRLKEMEAELRKHLKSDLEAKLKERLKRADIPNTIIKKIITPVEATTDKIFEYADPKDSHQLQMVFQGKGEYTPTCQIDYTQLETLDKSFRRLNFFDKQVMNVIHAIWAAQQTSPSPNKGQAITTINKICSFLGIGHGGKNQEKVRESIRLLGGVQIRWTSPAYWDSKGNYIPAWETNSSKDGDPAGAMLEYKMELVNSKDSIVKILDTPIVFKFAKYYHNLIRAYDIEILQALGNVGNLSERKYFIHDRLVAAITSMKNENAPKRTLTIDTDSVVRRWYGNRKYTPKQRGDIRDDIAAILTEWKKLKRPGWLADFSQEGWLFKITLDEGDGQRPPKRITNECDKR